MNLRGIENLEDLRQYLACALQLEHATIPPYLTAAYSIREGTNRIAYDEIIIVAREEMLHMALVANMLNAVGTSPNLLADGFVPHYPSYLPDGETEFKVNIQKFSPDAIDTFLRIELPGKANSGEKTVEQLSACRQAPLKVCRLAFKTIGDFYAEIRRGFHQLSSRMKREELFCGNPELQLRPDQENWWGGGGNITAINALEDVDKAISLISEQGEGYGGTIKDEQNELAHYYQFMQLKNNRCYNEGDEPDKPTGSRLDVDFATVYPIKENAQLSDYAGAPELHQAAIEFARKYRGMLALLNAAFNGNPDIMKTAPALMASIRDAMKAIIRNPIPGQVGVNAAPIFDLPEAY
jgi:hypothetical protein